MCEMKLVSVIYLNEKIGGYVGRDYAYIDPTGGQLKVGDKVIVPAESDNERKKAMVVDTDVSVPPEIQKKLKSVLGRAKA